MAISPQSVSSASWSVYTGYELSTGQISQSSEEIRGHWALGKEHIHDAYLSDFLAVRCDKGSERDIEERILTFVQIGGVPIKGNVMLCADFIRAWHFINWLFSLSHAIRRDASSFKEFVKVAPVASSRDIPSLESIYTAARNLKFKGRSAEQVLADKINLKPLSPKENKLIAEASKEPAYIQLCSTVFQSASTFDGNWVLQDEPITSGFTGQIFAGFQQQNVEEKMAALELQRQAFDKLLAGIHPSLSWAQNENDGGWSLYPCLKVVTPWQAICSALYSYACGRGGLQRCLNPSCVAQVFSTGPKTIGGRKPRSDARNCGRKACRKWCDENAPRIRDYRRK